MTRMPGDPPDDDDSLNALNALKRRIAGAPDAHAVPIVAVVDAMTSRGPADTLIAPLRQRLATLRPPRPLRFGRLLFHPLDPLIVPALQWRQNGNYIPRSALAPIAQHVRCAMGSQAATIEAELADRTTADLDLIADCGARVWPAAAQILADAAIPLTWDRSGIAPARYPALAARLAALLNQAGALDALADATANGLLAPEPQPIHAVLAGVITAHPPALPMVMTILLARIPECASTLSTLLPATLLPAAPQTATRPSATPRSGWLPSNAPLPAAPLPAAPAPVAPLPAAFAPVTPPSRKSGLHPGTQNNAAAGTTTVASFRAAFDAAADLLIRRMECEDGGFAAIASGSLSDAGASAGWIAALLEHLNAGAGNPRRQARLRAVRTKLNARFLTRFTTGCDHDLMNPLRDPALGSIAPPSSIAALESAARGLRILETEARILGGGATYDRLLADAAKLAADPASCRWLDRVDRIRLVEILAGPQAALTMLD